MESDKTFPLPNYFSSSPLPPSLLCEGFSALSLVLPRLQLGENFCLKALKDFFLVLVPPNSCRVKQCLSCRSGILLLSASDGQSSILPSIPPAPSLFYPKQGGFFTLFVRLISTLFPSRPSCSTFEFCRNNLSFGVPESSNNRHFGGPLLPPPQPPICCLGDEQRSNASSFFPLILFSDAMPRIPYDVTLGLMGYCPKDPKSPPSLGFFFAKDFSCFSCFPYVLPPPPPPPCPFNFFHLPRNFKWILAACSDRAEISSFPPPKPTFVLTR